jgi:tight adherence protein C
MMLFVLAFLGCFGFLASAGLLLFYRDAVLDRLYNIVDQRQDAASRRISSLLFARRAHMRGLVKPFQNLLPRSPREVSLLRKRLMCAGYRDSAQVNVFYGAKVLVPLALSLAAAVTGIYRFAPFFVFSVTAGIGFLLPDIWLTNRIANRKLAIRTGLPEALDLLVVCSEAGLGLDQSLDRVCAEIHHSQKEIHDELNLLLLEQKAGRPREDALRNLADRTGVESVRGLVNTLIQSDQFGGSIAKTLRVYSALLRTQRTQQAEEQAAKTTVKLVFPLVLFIFPSLFLVVLGPALIKMFEGFHQYLN